MSDSSDEETRDTSPARPDACHVCPAGHAGWLSLPLRRIVHPPRRILDGLVGPGDTAVDLGCGPGFFTLPLAEIVGEGGRVIAVDLQAEMLERLRVRAERAGLAARIASHQCTSESLGLTEQCDFALAFYMVHEVPDRARFFNDVHAALKPDGRFLLVEPWGHVGAAAFAATADVARGAGLRPVRVPRVAFSRAMLFERG